MRAASFLLRLGLAFTLLYAAVAGLVEPAAWVGFFPVWMRDIVAGETLLMIWGTAQVALAAWLMVGRGTIAASIVTTILLGGIVVVTIPVLDVTFRDVGLLFAAIALAALERERTRSTTVA